ncbi:MAG: ATP-binding cassette domain-containing protein [Anaerolineae bacterium]|nr:ATP-binding cassette domain-containing protein [Anaerolineae bacterium]
MNLVTITDVSKQFSERVLLNRVNLLINSGDRVGLIGRNGSGKTTLLRLIAGEEAPDDGTITVWGGVRIRFLSQGLHLDPALTVLDTVFAASSPQMRLLRDYEQVSRQLQQTPTDAHLQQRLTQLSAEMDRTDGWSAEANAKTILTKLGITDYDSPVGLLSGGQRKRVALAQALIDSADLLILDEPTNHIDAETIDWLERYLLTVPNALLMVTHDRYFLDRVTNRIVELNRQELIAYPGNYSDYLALREQREQKLAAQEEKRQILLRRELAWLQRGAQARSTKQKARKQRVAELQQIAYDRDDRRVAMALAGRRLGKKVLIARNLSKTYGEHTLFAGLNLQLEQGDRIGIVGPNGVGKTTLLDILAEKTKPDTGDVIWGSTVHLGYFDQHMAVLKANEQMRVFDFIARDAALIRTDEGERVDAARMLEWFLFTRPEQRARIVSLSGGERRRLYMLYVLMHRPNVVFLDEPTNDLDIETLQVLEEFLDNFSGALVVVTHDRYFLDRNVDFIMSFEDGHVGTRYPAPFSAFQQARQSERARLETPEPTTKPTGKPVAQQTAQPSDKLSWKEKRELEALETQMAELESRKAELTKAMNNAGGDYVLLGELSAEFDLISAELDTALERWLALSERVE